MTSNLANAAPAASELVVEDKEHQFLTFCLDNETYAIDILNIKEIIEYGSLTEVPMMPNFIRGVINLRGCVVPTIDLAVRFGRESQPLGPKTCVVILELEHESEAMDIGVIVDSVTAVVEIPRQDIDQAPAFGAKLRPEFIQGLGKVNGEFVVILDLNYALSVTEMAMLESAESASLEVQQGA